MNIDLRLGNCLEVMATLPENSIDTIITDPPYGLKFMGKDWDKGVPGVAFWEQALRVAKPGAMLLAMGGTRTFHRLVSAIEDAGWEIRDSMAWLYGCLSEDTEILTINGWEHYHKDIELYPVLCYNIDKESFEFCKPERSFIYENKHTAYRIQSDYTDQIVSRNHRCIVERGGRKVFAYAETLEQQESVPILESLHNLPETIPNIYEGTSVKKQDLLERVRQQECKHSEYWQSPAGAVRRQNACSVCSVWETGMETKSMVKKGGNAYLQSSMQRSIKRAGMEAACAQRQTKLDGRIREVSQRKNDRAEQSCMEGRRNLLQNTWELCWSKICSLPGRIYGNVKKRRLCNGTPFNSCANTRKMLKEDGSRSSHRPQSSQQRPEQFNVICEQPTAQEIRSDGATRTTLATVNPIEYKGNVWCVQVPTGAFVARRNGHIFITGNSGFPKSYDISKGIDKQAGAKREVVGIREDFNKRARKNGVPSSEYIMAGGWKSTAETVGILTAPATEAAQLWHGWGTALKPAMELICVAMKPIDGTFVNNALTWGVAGLNIDGSRVQTDEELGRNNHTNPYGSERTWSASSTPPQNNVGAATNGRFPANVIHDGSDSVVSLFPQTGKVVGRVSENSKSDFAGDGGWKGDGIGQRTYDGDGSVARFFYCAKASQSERNAGLDCYLTVKYNNDKSNNGGLSWEDVSTVAVQLLRKVMSDTETLSFNIGESGESITGQCLKDSLSTILTATSKTIESKILHSLMLSLTSDYTAGVNYEMVNGGNHAENVESLRKWILTTTNGQLELARGASNVALQMLLKAKSADAWSQATNIHATVKPVALMSYLARLTKTPTGGTVLDPFMGSGTTGVACVKEGRSFIGIELDEGYLEIAKKRIEHAQTECTQLSIDDLAEE